MFSRLWRTSAVEVPLRMKIFRDNIPENESIQIEVFLRYNMKTSWDIVYEYSLSYKILLR